MARNLVKDEWIPPPSPLTRDLIQRGQSPVFHVAHEHATNPFGAELEHWSALPALSYFALNAVALRESARRIQPPSKFRPPPRVTLSDARCQFWLADLKSPRVPLRKLARTIPHGLSGLKLLETMLDLDVPVGRAIWFAKCIGANEVRVLKRKAGLGDGGAERNDVIEKAWLESWTEAVQQLLVKVVKVYDGIQPAYQAPASHKSPAGHALTPLANSIHAAFQSAANISPPSSLNTPGAPLSSAARGDTPGSVSIIRGDSPLSFQASGKTISATLSPEVKKGTPEIETELDPFPNDDSDVDNLFTDEAEVAIEEYGAFENSQSPGAPNSRDSNIRDEEYEVAAVNEAERLEKMANWQKQMKYTTHLIMSLYNESLLDRQAFLDWLLAQLRDAAVLHLPCYVHLVQLLWVPFTNSYMAPQLLRSVALRLSKQSAQGDTDVKSRESTPLQRNLSSAQAEDDTSMLGVPPPIPTIGTGAHEVLISILEPIIFKLMSTNDNVFVTPRTWPLIEPYVRSHPAYGAVAERNQAFMPKDPHDPSDWSKLSAVDTLIANFSRPYHTNELVTHLCALDIPHHTLVKTILSLTSRLETSASILLCIAILKRLRTILPHVNLTEVTVEFLMEIHPENASSHLNALVHVLLREKLFKLSRYLNRLIARDVLHSDDPCQLLHIGILRNLPLSTLNPSVRTQVIMMLRKAGSPVEVVDLQGMVSNVVDLLRTKQGEGLLLLEYSQSLRLEDQYSFAEKLVTMYSDRFLHNSGNLDEGKETSRHVQNVQYSGVEYSGHNVVEDVSMNEMALGNSEVEEDMGLPSAPDSTSAASHEDSTVSERNDYSKVNNQESLPSTAVAPESVEFAHFCTLVDRYSLGNVRPIARLLESAVSSTFAGPSFISGILRQVHDRLMELTCADAIDPFVLKFVSRLDLMTHETVDSTTSLSYWVSWDDISVIRSVIQSPEVMFSLNRLVPLRPDPEGHHSTDISGHTPMERESIRSLLHRPSPNILKLLSRRGEEGLMAEIAEFSKFPESDRVAILQLIAYGAGRIKDIVENGAHVSVELLKWLLLVSSNEFGFCFEEVEALGFYRHEYLDSLTPKDFLGLCVKLKPWRFASRISHRFPDIYEVKLIEPARRSSEFLTEVQGVLDMFPSFVSLLTTCTPFNLRYRQALISMIYLDADPDELAHSIVAAAYAHPRNSSALQGLLQTISPDVKNRIFMMIVKRFLKGGLDAQSLESIEVPYSLVGALASSVKRPLLWTLDDVPEFLHKLVSAAESTPDYTDHELLRKVLILVLRISVVARLHKLEMPTAAVPFLDQLLHVQAFADDHKTRTIIEDALRLLIRIAQPNESRIYSGGDEVLVAGGGVADGLRLYSKSKDQYTPLPVWSFDLIENTSVCIGNDGPVDLSLFEAYLDN